MNLEGAEWAVWRCSRGIWGTQRYPERSNRKILTNFRVASTSSWRPSSGRTIPEMQLNAAEQHSLIWQKSCDLIWHRSSRSLHHHTPHYLLRFGSTIDNVHSGWCLFKICWAIIKRIVYAHSSKPSVCAYAHSSNYSTRAREEAHEVS
jgi:hypothetical protein